MNISRPLILGIAKGVVPDQLKAFVLSLRKSGYRGDVCIFVDDLPAETLIFLHDHQVQLQAFPKRYFVQTRRFFLRFAADILPASTRAAGKISFSQYYLKLNDARWACYFDFLKATRGLYTHVMFTDVKDVVFQRDPFDFEWKSPLCSFYEPPGTFIKDQSHNLGWIRQGYGERIAREMEDKRIICSGVTFAEIDAALDYLEIMCTHLMKINSRGLIDQGVYNYLFHYKLLKNFYIYDHDETPVLHLALMPTDKIATNDQGLLVNGSGRVVNTVHQYLYHMQAMRRCLDLVAT